MTIPDPHAGLPPYPQELPAIISRDEGGFTVIDRERLDAFHAELDAHSARLEADRSANQPVTPAEERTGVSDVLHAVAESAAELRRGIELLKPHSPGLVAHLLWEVDRIEHWTRGQS